MRQQLEELAKRLDTLYAMNVEAFPSLAPHYNPVKEAAAAIRVMLAQEPVILPSFVERHIRQAIEAAHNPPPGSMVVGMPKAMVLTDKLDYVLRKFDAGLYAAPVPAVETVTLSEHQELQKLVTAQGIRLMEAYDAPVPTFDADEAMRLADEYAERCKWMHEGNESPANARTDLAAYLKGTR